MNINTLIENIPRETQSFGEMNDDVLESLAILDDELMKRGTLSGTSMDWELVQKTSADILKTVSHIAAFRGLVSFLCRNGEDHSFHSAILLGTAFFSAHFPKLHPKGKSQLRRRIAWAKEIVKTLEAGAEAVIETNRGLSPDCKSALLDCISAAKSAGQDTSGLQKMSKNEFKESEIKRKNNTEAQTSTESPSKLDAKGRGLLKRDIRSIADRITAHDPDAGIAYLLRGYAAWLEFQFLPASDEKGITQQQAMPSAITDEHRKNLNKASIETLSKIEDRLFMSPDWFVGQKIAHDMALSLGYNATAQSILERTKTRIELWPDLKILKHTNGSDFISADIIAWVMQTLVSRETTSSDVNSDDDSKTLQSLMEEINVEITEAISPRTKALAKLKLARFLASEDLNGQAEMMFEELSNQIRSTNAADWDSALLRKIKNELRLVRGSVAKFSQV